MPQNHLSRTGGRTTRLNCAQMGEAASVEVVISIAVCRRRKAFALFREVEIRASIEYTTFHGLAAVPGLAYVCQQPVRPRSATVQVGGGDGAQKRAPTYLQKTAAEDGVILHRRDGTDLQLRAHRGPVAVRQSGAQIQRLPQSVRAIRLT